MGLCKRIDLLYVSSSKCRSDSIDERKGISTLMEWGDPGSKRSKPQDPPIQGCSRKRTNQCFAMNFFLLQSMTRSYIRQEIFFVVPKSSGTTVLHRSTSSWDLANEAVRKKVRNLVARVDIESIAYVASAFQGRDSKSQAGRQINCLETVFYCNPQLQ